MLPSTCLVVPTYWTRSGNVTREGDAVYDHPTPVNGESTLRKLLDSLDNLDTSRFYLLVLVSVTGADVTEEAEKRVAELVGEHTSLRVLVFGPSGLQILQRRLVEDGVENPASFLNLAHYPKIRNLQLAVPLVLGSQAIVAVDDDEIVTDPQFLDKAVEPLGTRINGAVVDGLSGYYLQEDGSILLKVDPDKAQSSNLFDRKAVIMNEATERLEAQPDNIVLTPFCFGGNMEFTAELAASVGFDPGITRGEDIDYLINARLEGKHIYMRKDLRILHCPPKGGSYKDANWSKLEQDVIRFAYEREKLRVAQSSDELETLTVDDLMPYPGEFLTRDLEGDAREALKAAGYPQDVDAFLHDVRAAARQKVDSYLSFRKEWPQVMARLQDDHVLRDQMEGLVRQA